MSRKRIAVYCSASNIPGMMDRADHLGAQIAFEGWDLVYGGGAKGLMGAVASGVTRHLGNVYGYIPRHLVLREGAYQHDRARVVQVATMAERKRMMELESSAFVVLPGGLGTLDELFQVLTDAAIGLHTKPIVLVNWDRVYDPMLDALSSLCKHNYISTDAMSLLNVVEGTKDAIDRLKACGI